MNNTFLDSLKRETNYTKTENNGVAHKSTLNAVYDMFALGGAYRNSLWYVCIRWSIPQPHRRRLYITI